MDKAIMSEEAFNEIVEGFEHIRTLTEWGSKNIKQHIQRLQQKNESLKQVLDEIEKIILKATTDEETGKDLGYSDKISYDDLLEIIQKAKGDIKNEN
jgi:pyridoxal biosynthesis lyase PdxS